MTKIMFQFNYLVYVFWYFLYIFIYLELFFFITYLIYNTSTFYYLELLSLTYSTSKIMLLLQTCNIIIGFLNLRKLRFGQRLGLL